MDYCERENKNSTPLSSYAAVPALVKLQCSANPRDPHVHWITRKFTSVGRGSENDINIKNSFISRTHCIIQNDCGSGKWCIINLSSSCTYLNGKQLGPYDTHILQFGDLIQFAELEDGKYEFRRIDAHQKIFDYNTCHSDQATINRLMNSLRYNLAKQQRKRKELSHELQQHYFQHQKSREASMRLNSELQDLMKKVENKRAELEQSSTATAVANSAYISVKLSMLKLFRVIKAQCSSHESRELDSPILVSMRDWQDIKSDFNVEYQSIKDEIMAIENIDQPFENVVKTEN